MKKITFKLMFFVGFTLLGVTTQSQTLLDAEDGTYNKLSPNVMANGTGESSADFTVVANPNPTGINTSSKVVQFRRNTSLGDPWAGFWSPVVDPDPDFTTNKYVHVKVLKTKLSPVKFKLEGGAAGNIEIASMNTYTTAGVWQDMVFDFSAKTGTYPTVILMPDFEDPMTKTGDIMIYFDDIKLNNSSTPEVLGIQKNALATKIQMFPNPTKDVLRIQSSEALSSATIFSVDGRKVLEISKFENGTTSINISSLSNGAYLINFKAASGATLAERFIKE